jgi:hypothetical protein
LSDNELRLLYANWVIEKLRLARREQREKRRKEDERDRGRAVRWGGEKRGRGGGVTMFLWTKLTIVWQSCPNCSVAKEMSLERIL